jgi:hypothetical protein
MRFATATRKVEQGTTEEGRELDGTKVSVLLAIYESSNRELLRFRDLEWKLASGAAAFLAGVAVFLGQATVQKALTAVPALRTVLAVSVALIPAALWYFYYHSQASLEFHRIVRQRVEEALRVCAAGVYGPKEIIPPPPGDAKSMTALVMPPLPRISPPARTRKCLRKLKKQLVLGLPLFVLATLVAAICEVLILRGLP